MKYLILTLVSIAFVLSTKAQIDPKASNDTIGAYISKAAKARQITDSPLLVIDGFAISYSDYLARERRLSNADVKQIELLPKKSKTAITVYGDRAKGGVLLIMTSHARTQSKQSVDKSKVLFLLEGKEITMKELEQLNPNDIESIEVIKDSTAVRKITEDDYEGVVKINMKKGQSTEIK